MRITIYTFIICSCLIIGATVVARAQAGSLDLTFGSDGKVTTAIGNYDDGGSSVVIQSDGKIIVAGESYNGINKDFALVRYNSDGTLDSTFSSDGKVTTAVGNDDDFGGKAAIQSDGKIVVAGSSKNGYDADFALVRYNSEGSLDTTFGFDGKVTTNFASDGWAISVAMQSDGKIVVAGYCSILFNDWSFALARYNSDGSLDNGFGSDGIVKTPIGNNEAYGRSVALQSDGKIVVTGYSYNVLDPDFALVRYNNDGSLDPTFGSSGIVTTDFGSSQDYGWSVAIQSDGKIVVAGYTNNGSGYDFAVARYDSDGSLDSGFGSNGIIKTLIGNIVALGQSVTLQSDGKIVVAGESYNGINEDFALVRYNSDGSLDNTFGSDGNVTTNFGGNDDRGYSVVIQSDGKIVVAGSTYNGSDYDFAVARYNADSTTGIAENTTEQNTISISPNPVQSQLTINLATHANEVGICVYDLQGRMIALPISFQNDKAQLNTDNLHAGFYTIQITHNKTGRIEVRKFVKQN